MVVPLARRGSVEGCATKYRAGVPLAALLLYPRSRRRGRVEGGRLLPERLVSGEAPGRRCARGNGSFPAEARQQELGQRLCSDKTWEGHVGCALGDKYNQECKSAKDERRTRQEMTIVV